MPEVVAIQFVGGPYCGRELRIDAAGVETIGLAWEGETAVYRLDTADGNFVHEPSVRKSPISGDAIYGEVVRLVGEPALREMLATVAIREALKGDKDFWQALAAQMNRKAEGTA